MNSAYKYQRDLLSLIKNNKYESVAEIGVWRGDTSRLILQLPFVKQLILVDPYLYGMNIFDCDEKVAPDRMPEGMYFCTMGEKVKNQDELNELYRVTFNSLRPYGNRVEFLRMDSIQACKKISFNSLDIVFIDAVHTYPHVKEDIKCWLPKIKLGGMIAGDNYESDFPGVIKAVDELLPERTIFEGGPVWYYLVKDANEKRLNGM